MAFLCIDESEHSERAFNFYSENLHEKGSVLNLVHIHVPPGLPPGGLYGDSINTVELYSESLKSSIEESKAVVDKFKHLCNNKGIACKTFVQTVEDSIGNTICQILKSNNPKLVVLGQRGVGVIRRTLFGSVSDYVLHHCHVPVTIVPHN